MDLREPVVELVGLVVADHVDKGHGERLSGGEVGAMLRQRLYEALMSGLGLRIALGCQSQQPPTRPAG